MKIVFLGVGSAVDESQPNTSILVLSKTKLLLDCGYSIPQALWRYNPDPNFLDAVFISHLHGDHYFGLPALFLRMNEDGRKKPLQIICTKKAAKEIWNLAKKAYPTNMKNLTFSLHFITVQNGAKIDLNELSLSFAKTRHLVSNLAVKVTDGKKTLCYSGDGDFTKASEKLYRNADLLIHEGFLFNKKFLGHGSITDVVKMARAAKVKTLKIVHVNRKEKNLPLAIKNLLAKRFEIILI